MHLSWGGLKLQSRAAPPPWASMSLWEVGHTQAFTMLWRWVSDIVQVTWLFAWSCTRRKILELADKPPDLSQISFQLIVTYHYMCTLQRQLQPIRVQAMWWGKTIRSIWGWDPSQQYNLQHKTNEQCFHNPCPPHEPIQSFSKYYFLYFLQLLVWFVLEDRHVLNS